MNSKPLKTILYADDEDDIRAIAQIALEDIGGFIVRYCSDGYELLEAAKDYVPDLLLLDVMMPKMDGPAALKELRKRAEYTIIPAIFMTAKIQPGEIIEYQSLGAIDVIAKPFDPMSLAQAIQNAWIKHYEK